MPPTPATVRAALVDALRLDLVGPDPDSDHAREVLSISPSAWYLTGFLVPFLAKAEERSDPEAQEDLDEARPPSPSDDDATPEKPSGRRGHLPSSIGLSVLVPPAARQFEATVSWGDYKAEEVQEEGRDLPTLHWHRHPGEASVIVAIPAPGARPQHVPVPGGDGLCLVLTARQAVRSAAPGRLPAGTLAVSAFLVNHRDPAPDKLRDEGRVFQAAFRLRCDTPLVPRPDPRRFGEEQWDERVADLQYRDVVEYAVGHGVAAHAEPDADGPCRDVRTTWIPAAEVEKVDPAEVKGVQFGMEVLADTPDAPALQAVLRNLVSEYRTWQGLQAGNIPALPGQDRQQMARLLLERAAFAAERIEAGIELLAEPLVFEAFRTANRAMARAARQRESQWRGKPPGQVPPPHWRPFQLAFVLMNLRGVVHPEHADRGIVDLLFFPTGGGKTEAYLGLAAFTLVWRRLRDPSIHSAGLAVLMRYTLRLLTLDQLGRAAGLICALELERQEREDELGSWPFEIGMWVGQAATPNRMGHKGDNDKFSARTRTIAYQNKASRPAPIPLESCPWCGEKFKPTSFSLRPKPDHPTDLRIVCLNPDCAFKKNNFLPILTVDEPIYRRLPCFLVATVDKFAALPWVGESGALLGQVDRHDAQGFYGPATPHRGVPLERPLPPPALIIQDELHLISGPLGTVAGFYETAIDHLCTRHEQGVVVRPKIVASTATVRRADTQIQAIFGRSQVEVFPPPGSDRRDSFFAETVSSDRKNARLYLGVAAQGRSMKVTLLRAYLALLAGAQRAWLDAGGAKNPANPADPLHDLARLLQQPARAGRQPPARGG
ncbi:MAG: helicase [Pseudomonadota bacterium]